MSTGIQTLKMKTSHKHLSSFRDPSGYIFVDEGMVYRRVNASYFDKFTNVFQISNAVFNEEPSLLAKG